MKLWISYRGEILIQPESGNNLFHLGSRVFIAANKSQVEDIEKRAFIENDNNPGILTVCSGRNKFGAIGSVGAKGVFWGISVNTYLGGKILNR